MVYSPPMRSVLNKAYNAWMAFAHVLGWINGRIILTVLYIVVFGPYAIIRMLGRLIVPRPAPATYWVTKEQEEPTVESLRRLF